MINFDKIINPAVAGIKPSGIRKFFDIAAEMDDVISLGVGEPDFITPAHIRDAGIRSLNMGHTYYTSNSGLKELREEITKYMKRRFSLDYKPSETLVTVGGSEAIDLFIRSVVSCGDEVLIPEPSFVCYSPCVLLAGGKPVPLETYEKDDFRLTADTLKKAITDKTKLLVMPFPNNPTGAVMEREHLEEIADVLRGTDILVLSDEIYAELTYGIKHTSIAELEDMRERTVIVSGFSKAYAMTGWRMGYALGNEKIISMMIKIHQFAIMSAPTVSQYASIEAMRHGDEDIEKMKKQYNYRRRVIVDGFNSMGLHCFEPKGAFYAFPSIKNTGMTSLEFAEKLLYSEKVAVVPGDAFGASGEGFIRCSYAYSIEEIEIALERIERFVKTIL